MRIDEGGLCLPNPHHPWAGSAICGIRNCMDSCQGTRLPTDGKADPRMRMNEDRRGWFVSPQSAPSVGRLCHPWDQELHGFLSGNEATHGWQGRPTDEDEGAGVTENCAVRSVRASSCRSWPRCPIPDPRSEGKIGRPLARCANGPSSSPNVHLTERLETGAAWGEPSRLLGTAIRTAAVQDL